MSDGKGEQKGEGTAMISGMPATVQLRSSGSMGVRGPRDRRGWLHHVIIATPLFTHMRFGVTPYQLTNEIGLEKYFRDRLLYKYKVSL